MSNEQLSAPLSLSEDAARPLHAINPETGVREADPLVPAVEPVLYEARQQAVALAELDSALRRDPSIAPSARALRLRQAAERIGVRVAERLDSARAALTSEIARLETMTAAPQATAIAASADPEIRAALRQMSPAQRRQALAKAQTDGDLSVLGAALRAPAALTIGLDAAEHGMMVDQFRRSHFPAETARLQRLQACVRSLDVGITSFAGFIGRAVASDEARRAEAAASASARATAAVEEGA